MEWRTQVKHSIWRTVFLRAALALASVAPLAGCAAQVATPAATPSLTAASATATVREPTVTPTPTFVVIPGTPGEYGPACHSEQLALTIGVHETATGTSTEMGTVTNHSSTACSLFGFPGAQLLDAQRTPLAIQTLNATSGVWGGVFAEQYVQLAPGASASFAVAWSAAPTDAQANCLTSSYFAMTPPGDSSAVVATDAIHVCGAITISPYQNAPFFAS